MKVFYSFLIIFALAVLFMLPITQGVYAFRTDVKEDTFRYPTAVGETTANVTLLKEVYDDDVTTVSVLSDIATDVPVIEGYTAGTRLLDISGLAANATRTLSVSYDYDALNASGAFDIFLSRLSWIWLLCVIGFAPAALWAIITNRA